MQGCHAKQLPLPQESALLGVLSCSFLVPAFAHYCHHHPMAACDNVHRLELCLQLLQQLLGTAATSDKTLIALCGIGKMFVGDVIEMGECVQAAGHGAFSKLCWPLSCGHCLHAGIAMALFACAHVQLC
jgi:hypothetical protein